MNYNSIKRFINLDLLSIIIFEKNHKCEICVQSKFTKTYFHLIERSSAPLGLIHSDIGNLKFMQTRGGKNIILFL